MFLHLNRAIFVRVVSNISAKSGLPMEVVEKDYYITMILKQFSKDCSDIIFKGGTSLSKAHHVLNRFSEDIDLTFDRKVTEGQRKKLKHNTVLGIGKELKLEITGLERTRSKRDYNGYTYHYLPLVKYGTINSILAPQVRGRGGKDEPRCFSALTPDRPPASFSQYTPLTRNKTRNTVRAKNPQCLPCSEYIRNHVSQSRGQKV